jgi:hypothetical protein
MHSLFSDDDFASLRFAAKIVDKSFGKAIQAIAFKPVRSRASNNIIENPHSERTSLAYGQKVTNSVWKSDKLETKIYI